MNGYVYFIAPDALLHRSFPDNVVKIGFTTGSVEARRSALQIGSPLPLKVWGYTPGSLELESAFHRSFADVRSHGEWFFAKRQLADLLRIVGEEPDVGRLVRTSEMMSILDEVTGIYPPPDMLQPLRSFYRMGKYRGYRPDAANEA